MAVPFSTARVGHAVFSRRCFSSRMMAWKALLQNLQLYFLLCVVMWHCSSTSVLKVSPQKMHLWALAGAQVAVLGVHLQARPHRRLSCRPCSRHLLLVAVLHRQMHLDGHLGVRRLLTQRVQ